MSLVVQAIPALFNGVSQQPATVRLPSQSEAEVNTWSTVAEGMMKRPPFRHVAKVSNTSFAGAFIHTINRDTNERYIVILTSGSVRVFDLAGVEKTVNSPNGMTYLTSADPANDFGVVTVADYSFIVNRSQLVGRKAALADESLPVGYASYRSPWYADGRVVSDTGYRNYAGASFKGSKQTFQDLPKTTDAPPPAEGDVWKIAGYDENSFASYYVRRTGGVWEETIAGGLLNALDEFTMPHCLIREADGTFTFTPFNWNVRKFGDEKSNPPPTFLGSSIRDVFFYKNRLGFVADENVIFSCAGDFGNFWRNTVTVLLDSDVVDVAISTAKVSRLRFAVPFQNNLMLFSDQTQFSLNVDQILTPATVSVDVVTNYEMSLLARPVGLGTDVYFITETGNYSRVREYFVQDGTNANDASDITAHVPRFLPKNITRLAGNSNEDVLFMITGDYPNRIYNYKFFWYGDEKSQSAWRYWTLDAGDSILSIDVLAKDLFALIERSDGVYLERCDVQTGAITGGLPFQVLLDRGATMAGTYVSGPDYTEFTLPYVPTTAADLRVIRGESHTAPGSLIDPTTYTFPFTNILRVPGNEAAGSCYCGIPYTQTYTFSEQFVRNGNNAVTTGRTMLRTFTVYFTDTAFFRTSVAPYGNDALVESVVPSSLSEFTGKTLGDAALILNAPVFATGKYSFQIYGDSTVATVSLVNDTHVQSKFSSAEVEMLYHNRARPLQ